LSHEHLGLFDTPADRKERTFAGVIVGILVVVFLVVLPVKDIGLGEVPAFVVFYSAILLLGELIIAALLYAQAAVFRSRALILLASSFVFTALLLIPFALTFPGTFAPGGLLRAGVGTTAWLKAFREWAGPLSVILYVWFKQADSATAQEAQRAPPRVLLWVSMAAALAAWLTMLATVEHDLLPPLFVNRSDVIYSNLILYSILLIALLAIAMGMLLRRRNTVLDTWLGVSLATALIATLLTLQLHARFTLGWYCAYFLELFSHLVVLLVLIGESNRLYVRLALSTAARSRERDAVMTSMDAVAAEISHEVGQPLAAVSLSATAALRWLTPPHPKPEMAIKSLRDTVSAASRAFAVMASIRDTFRKGTISLSEFDLNDLVRESASVLDREMAAQKVLLRLELDEALPPIQANRVQIQRVLVNLLTNAIESVAATKQQPRRIGVHSWAPDRETLRVEVTDSGAGISPGAMAQIFEPFFTSKLSGTGLGLSLSRSIVERHGGRLWAAAAVDGGASFHIELPRTSRPMDDGDEREG
jgi:signal transduction histidine kinase